MSQEREIGNTFYAAMKSGTLDYGEQRSFSVDSNAAQALLIGTNPKLLTESRGVFMGGRVFDRVVEEKQVIFENLSPWRDHLGAIIESTGKIPLHGLAMDLHHRNVAAGAGRAYLAAFCAPVHIIEGTGRVGDATLEEGLFSLSLGHNVGLILNPDDYDGAIRYIDGKTNIYPTSLPAYWASLDIQREDLIRGNEMVEIWIKEQFNKIHPNNFRNRFVGQNPLSLMMHYIFNYSNLRNQDMAPFAAVVSDFSGANLNK
jgi:hypothetical protein